MVTAVETSARVSAEAVLAALAEVADPEIPAISIVDLGIVHRADIAADGRIEVELLPTFVGCPAIEAIRHAVSERLATFGLPVDVAITFEVPWTSERITAAGRAPPPGLGLRAAGGAGGRPLPLLQLPQRGDGQRVRPDPLSLAVLLPSLPPAVRVVQADMTAVAVACQ